MERIVFYEFLPTKTRELEIQEKRPSTFTYALIRRWNRKTQQKNFLKKLELQQNVDQLQEADDHDHDDDAHFHDHLPPQEWQWPIVKALTKSDVGDLCRLVLHRSHVDTFFPEWSPALVQNIARGGKQHRILIRDTDTLSEHRLVFRRWSSNGLYVIQSNWPKEFVQRRRLEAGDVIGLCWNSEDNCFLFSVLKRA